jgi:hypothetical protein
MFELSSSFENRYKPRLIEGCLRFSARESLSLDECRPECRSPPAVGKRTHEGVPLYSTVNQTRAAPVIFIKAPAILNQRTREKRADDAF